jgi:16S rRNA (guanine966-N2)-methyltransferase
MEASLRVGTGTVKGRRLKQVAGSIRPTSGRVRGALFDSLADWIIDRTVVDLCAGSGSLGIEALSRGAEFGIFVDADRQAVRMIKENLQRCGFETCSKTWHTDVIRALNYFADQSCRVDLILADPPYDDPVVQKIIDTVSTRSILTPDGVLVVEHRKKMQPEMPQSGLVFHHRRDFGDTTLSFYQADSTSSMSLPIQPVVSPVDLSPPSSRSRR